MGAAFIVFPGRNRSSVPLKKLPLRDKATEGALVYFDGSWDYSGGGLKTPQCTHCVAGKKPGSDKWWLNFIIWERCLVAWRQDASTNYVL